MSGVSVAMLPSEEPFNFSWVIAGKLCASSRPTKTCHMQFLGERRVGHVVCLAEEFQPPPHQGLVIHTIPVEEFEPPTLEQMQQFITICEQAHLEEKAVCVHCRMGRGRTGVMLACYLVRFFGQVPQEAVTNVRLQRPYSVETWEQEYAVRDYHDFLARNRE